MVFNVPFINSDEYIVFSIIITVLLKISNTVNLIYYTAFLYLSIKKDGSKAKFNNKNPANIIKPLNGQWKNSNMVPIPKENSVKNAIMYVLFFIINVF